ncbi:hypothetical protein [Cereibacter sphaeroides]|uniref:hypothetical protein n=1 Tax=Cereibacter sphaeroides TaxID=1063 RepID=UPI003AF03BB9
MGDAGAAVALWWAVIVSGLYHGLNPGMGWPLAVSAALMDRSSRRAMPRALAALATGHFLAMAAILLPFSLMAAVVLWQREVRIAGGLAVVAMGLYLLASRRHPRFLARVPPTRLALWSFLAAIVHGAGLMLVPIYLGLCGDAEALDEGERAAGALMAGNLRIALLVALLHTTAMIGAGGALAIAVHAWLGLGVLSRAWFNLDAAWAVSLIVFGGFGAVHALLGPM